MSMQLNIPSETTEENNTAESSDSEKTYYFSIPDGKIITIIISDDKYDIIYPNKSCEFRMVGLCKNILDLAKDRAARHLNIDVNSIVETDKPVVKCTTESYTGMDLGLDFDD